MERAGVAKLAEMPLFKGCRDRIERATAHREALGKLWADWIDEDPYSFSIVVQRDGRGTMFIQPRNHSTPHDWSLELGEILYHLRAALDGAIYQSAIIESGLDPPPRHKKLEFPIYTCPSEFAKYAARKIGTLSQTCREFIESVQPYHTPDMQPELMVRNVNRNLGIINDWARKDRHRTLHVVGAWASSANPQLRLPPSATLQHIHVTGEGFLDKEREIATFAIEGYRPGSNVQGNPDLMIDVAVNEDPKPIAETDTLGNRLTEMIGAVAFVVWRLESIVVRSTLIPDAGTQT